MLGDVPFDLVSLNDIGIDDEVEETGETFEENAALKAETYARLSGLPALADDSGLEVDALGGEPGVRSARTPRTQIALRFCSKNWRMCHRNVGQPVSDASSRWRGPVSRPSSILAPAKA